LAETTCAIAGWLPKLGCVTRERPDGSRTS
jgi:hypothetical protein